MKHHPDVALGVPQILDQRGQAQQLCKRHPQCWDCSAVALAGWLKPAWLKRYDRGM